MSAAAAPTAPAGDAKRATSASAATAVPTGPKSAAKPAASARPSAKTKIDITLLAPADEYFGPLRQSIIGINNTLRDIGRRYDVNHDIPTQSLASAELTERSIRDWEKRYPRDTQLPRSVYLLQRLYTKVLIQSSRDRAHDTATWLFHDFNGSPQAKQLKKTLASEHLAPLPPPTPAPTPTPLYPSVFGPSYPSRFSPASGGATVPVASPTPTGSSMPASGASGAPSGAVAPVAPGTAAPAKGSPAPRASPSGAVAPVPTPH